MRIMVCAFLVLFATSAHAASVAEYDALRAMRPDGRTVTVQGLSLVRDAFTIELRSGVVHLLAPVRGTTVGAVFIGDGAYRLTPATAAERRQLRLQTGEAQLETLTDRFDRLVLFFTDRTAAEIMAHAPVATGAPNEPAVRFYEDYLRRQQRDVQINLQLRLLGDLLNFPGRTEGVFLAPVEGKVYGKALIVVDPLGISNLSPRLADLGGEEVALISMDERKGGFWYLSALAKEATSGRGKPVRRLADAARYEIETVIDSREIHGRTRITLTPLAGGIRVLPLNVAEILNLRSAVLVGDAGDVPLAIVRDEVQIGGYRGMFSSGVGDGDVAIVFPTPLSVGAPVKIQIEYDGRDVLEASGDGRYAVRARESWYPNLGTFVDLAKYELVFTYPKKNTLVSVGQLVSETVEGNVKIGRWRSDTPIRVAGFNYGEFQKLTTRDADSGVTIGVYTVRDWTPQAKIAQADAMNASRVATAFFGKQPFGEISITQQVESNFGQSWPTLVFLPTLALTSSTQRAFGLNVDERDRATVGEFVNVVGWHEVSHQWWGHHVGWQSYRDQWLSEGFAEFTAALTLEAAEGRRSYDRFWALRRGEILDRGGEVANADAGAITQGFRLATERSQRAARTILYGKGAYVLHMLRMMMQENRNGDVDAAFRAMMHEFVTTWAGMNPSTNDFQQIAEKHMLPVMNLTRDGRLDYFFEQWVHGTDIPTLTSALQVADIGGGKYRVSGTITQAGVPATFHTLVPVYLDFGDERFQKLGMVHLTGSATQNLSVDLPLPQKPRRAIVNAHNDVLSR